MCSVSIWCFFMLTAFSQFPCEAELHKYFVANWLLWWKRWGLVWVPAQNFISWLCFCIIFVSSQRAEWELDRRGAEGVGLREGWRYGGVEPSVSNDHRAYSQQTGMNCVQLISAASNSLAWAAPLSSSSLWSMDAVASQALLAELSLTLTSQYNPTLVVAGVGLWVGGCCPVKVNEGSYLLLANFHLRGMGAWTPGRDRFPNATATALC